MGLDQFLRAEFISASYKEEDEKKYNALLKTHGLKKEEVDNSGFASTQFTVGYWRKANSIHKWFVDNVQGGVDECQKSYVSREDLQKLKKACKDVLTDKAFAHKTLPSANGFFFGSTDYDAYYFDDLENTVKIIDKVLDNPKFNDCSFYYQASW